ncbi:MAG: hypothetical protein GF408_04075 [Candidatus Omnitrophica bacterium]|nr:hypothetical protein [Candidatus Omnitrophota bacterium]
MKAVIIFAVILMAFGTVDGIAAPGEKGASSTAMEKASDEAVFHRIGDWFATIGKSDQEKQEIIGERKAKRAAERADRQAERAREKARRQAEKANRKMKGAGKK